MTGCGSCASNTPQEQSLNPLFRRVLWVALTVNAAMFVLESIASQIGDSIALQADAMDFFADATNYAISLFVVGKALSTRARASMIKGLSMAFIGVFVLASALFRALSGSSPEPTMMGVVALMALAANVLVALLLYRYRSGDSNMRSIWLCSRNDAIGNIAVIVAAAGVFATASHWPDLIVASIIASLSLTSAIQIIKLARGEIRSTALPAATR